LAHGEKYKKKKAILRSLANHFARRCVCSKLAILTAAPDPAAGWLCKAAGHFDIVLIAAQAGFTPLNAHFILKNEFEGLRACPHTLARLSDMRGKKHSAYG
jgi:hypothetical protein